MQYLLVTALFAITLSPLAYAYFRRGEKTPRAARKALLLNIASAFALSLLAAGYALSGGISAAEAAAAAEGSSQGLRYIAAAISVGTCCIGGGIAVSGAASSALGAISENPKIFGQALLMVVLAEGIAIYGILISVLILNS